MRNSTQLRLIVSWLAGLAINLTPTFTLRAVLLRLMGNRIGRVVAIHPGIRWYDPWRKLSVGDHVTINRGCRIDNRCGVRIGSNVNISHDVRIYTLGHDIDDPRCGPKGAPVEIHDNAWLFPGVTVMPGVVIGEGAVVYPGSVVTRSVPPYEIVGGVPARRIRDRIREIDYAIDYRMWFGV
ncbi:MAG: acyltransferase [Burkholderiales bacterium]|jgi:acetyltransferase-like isoleucine patch superfamily enzyme